MCKEHDEKLPLDIIVVTPEEFEYNKDQIGAIIHPVASEGKVLCARIA
ncbi:MAG: hypothetical protein WC074_05890 [bacterium]